MFYLPIWPFLIIVLSILVSFHFVKFSMVSEPKGVGSNLANTMHIMPEGICCLSFS